eukprot:765110-Hanusia_phi.AAC.6
MPLKTMRGVWRFQQEVGGRGCTGSFVFSGQYDQPNRGDVTFAPAKVACYSRIRPEKPVRGPWRMKPSRRAATEGREDEGGMGVGGSRREEGKGEGV